MRQPKPAWAFRLQRIEPMLKTQVVASFGQKRLMLPAWVKAALSANDRLKVFLTVLQSASTHASHPNRGVHDLTTKLAQPRSPLNARRNFLRASRR